MDTDSKQNEGGPHATPCLTMTIEKAAKALGIARSTAYSLAGTGELPTIRLGRRILVPCHAVEKLVGLERERA